MQNLVAQRILERLAEKTDTKISASKVSFSHFKDLRVKDLYIEDQKGDTLIYAPLAIANLDSLNKKERFVRLSHLELKSATVNLEQFSSKEYNFSFLIDSLYQADIPDSLRWEVEFDNIVLNNNNWEIAIQGIDTFDFDALSTEVYLTEKMIDLTKLSFVMGNGFELKRLESSVAFSEEAIMIPSLSVETPNSSVILHDLSLKSQSGNLREEARDSLVVSLKSNQSYISPVDVNYFMASQLPLKNGLVVDGLVSGNLSHITGDELSLSSDSLLEFKGSFELTDFFTNENCKYELNIDTFRANIQNAAEIYRYLSSADIDVSSYKHWDYIDYSGALLGDAEKIEVNGTINSRYGSLKPLFSIHLPDSTHGLSYNGHLSTYHFQLGKALNNDNDFGRFTLNLRMEGNAHQDGMMHYFLADVPALVYNDYNYHNIEIEGVVDSNYVNSVVSIDDPNAHVTFSGEVDLNTQVPEYLFSLMASRVDLAALNILPDYQKFILRFDSYAQLLGRTIDELDGYSNLYELSVETESGEFSTDSLQFLFKPEDAHPSIRLKSDYINAELLGSYNFAELPGFINHALKGHLQHLPMVFDIPSNTTPNDFKFNIEIADLYKLAEAIDFPVLANGNTTISGELNSRLNTFNIKADIPYLMTSSQLLDSIVLELDQDYSHLNTVASVEQVTFVGDHMIKDLSLISNLQKDTMALEVDWSDKSGSTQIADFNSNLFVLPYGRELMGVMDVLPSTFVLSGDTWMMDASLITFIKERLSVKDFRLHNGRSHLMADGVYSKSLGDTLFLDLNEFDLAYIDQLLNIKNTSFSGLMSGDAAFYQLNGNAAMNSEIQVEKTKFNEADWGNIILNSSWDNALDALELDLNAYNDNVHTLAIDGLYYPALDSMAAEASFSGFKIDFIRPYIEHTLDSLDGEMYGNAKVNGPLLAPDLLGALLVKDGQFRIDYLSADYTINDSIYLNNNQFVFNDAKVQDQDGNYALVNGDITHTAYKNMMVDLQLTSDRFLALNNNAAENEYFFGDVYYGGLITIRTTDTETLIGSKAKTMSGSELTVPLSPVSVANKNNFIRFKEDKKTEVVERRKLLTLEKAYVPKRKLVIDMDFELTEDALVKLEFNSETGEVIKGQGNGNLNVQFEHGQPFQMFGEYEISKGEYLFSLQQLFNKRFEIIAGSNLRWSGRPGDAVMDITGRYSTKASLYNLMPDAIGENNKNRRVPVNVKLMLQGLLSQPDISFDIELPNTNEQTQQSVGSIIDTEDEISRQVLSLLIMNSFYTPEYYSSTSTSTQTNNQISSAAAVTASEFLSRQLSNWVSQINSNVDLGFYYVPGQELSDQGMTPQEYEMAISSQFFNDRLMVNSNFGYQDYSNTTAANLNSSFVGEIDLELKLNDNIKLKAYSHQNDDILYESNSFKQGVGISYQEEFENLAELEDRYKQRIKKIFSKKDKRNSEATERKEEEIEEEVVE